MRINITRSTRMHVQRPLREVLCIEVDRAQTVVTSTPNNIYRRKNAKASQSSVSEMNEEQDNKDNLKRMFGEMEKIIL